MVRNWAARIDMALKADPDRPSALLVIVNPFGGAKKALKMWESKAAPILEQAGKAQLIAAVWLSLLTDIVEGSVLSKILRLRLTQTFICKEGA